MSEADAQEGTTTTVEGVVVDKSFELDEFPVPAIRLSVRSERDDAASIRFTDLLPSGVSIDDVGLHPNYGEEALSIDDGVVVFERELDPHEEFTAVYGLREIDESDLASVPTDPDVEEVTPPLAESSSQVVRDVIEGDEPTDQRETYEPDDEVETLDLRDPNDEGEPSSESVGPEPAPDGQDEGESPDVGDLDIETPDAEGVDVSGDVAGVADALARELRTGDVDDEVVTLLRNELDLGSGSTEARIQRLQSEVADLHAYTEALEGFLDENGTTQQLLNDVRSELDRLDAQVTGNSERLTEQADDVASLEGTVESIEGELTDLRETVETYDETTRGLASDLEDYQEDLAELEERYERELDDMAARVDEIEGLEERYEEEVDTLQARVDDVTDDVAGVREEVSRVAEEVEDVERVDDRLEDLEETVEEMSSDLEEVAGIQQRLQSVFAGPSDDDEE